MAEPLRKGGTFCAMHTVLFPRAPAMASESIVVYIDLETNSLEVTGKIVEIGAYFWNFVSDRSQILTEF